MGGVSDVQIRDALEAAGATEAGVNTFAAALRSRIEQLGALCGWAPLALALLEGVARARVSGFEPLAKP